MKGVVMKNCILNVIASAAERTAKSSVNSASFFKCRKKLLSSTFIQSPVYGTRCSNFLNMRNQQWNWLEKTQWGDFKDQIIDLNIPLNKQS